ncbi:hypothetical protein HCN44_006770 [Aphidius gifuensis]|uniref:Tudor domain-containing protein n=1 Tax=Aphidius gifuensis TaxID=684658 RepID=A0A834Y0X3_APHGI|nr:hypothetical protein HCN44_006770 [Aphidius gifuensis]
MKTKIHNIENELSGPSDNESMNEFQAISAITQHFVHLHGVLQNLEGRMIETVRIGSKQRDKKLVEIRDHTKGLTEKFQDAMLLAGITFKHCETVDILPVIKKLETLVNLPCHLVKDTTSNENSYVKFHVEQITDILESHCKIEIQVANPYRLQTKEELPKEYILSQFHPSTPEYPGLDEVVQSDGMSPTLSSSISPVLSKSNQSSTLTLESGSIKASIVSTNSLNSQNNLQYKKSQMVHVTHLESPSKFYVRSEYDDDNFRTITEQLKAYNFSGTQPDEIIQNNIYAVCHNDIKIWYRGRVRKIDIINIDNDLWSVFAIDYGFEEINVSKKNIRLLSDDLLGIAPMAEEHRLVSIDPINGNQWSKEATLFMKRMLKDSGNDMSAEMYRYNEWNQRDVDLVVGSVNKSSIRDSLLLQGFGTFVSIDKLLRKNPDSSNAFHYEKLELEKYYSVEILQIENPHEIYVKKNDYDDEVFRQMSNELTTDYSKNKKTRSVIFSPATGMPCAVSYDKIWYRAIIVNVPKPKIVTVFLVDYGKKVTVKFSKMLRLDPSYQSITTRAIKISLRDVAPPVGSSTWSKKASTYIQAWTPGKVRIIAYEKIDSFYSVCLLHKKENLNSKLVLVEEAISIGPVSKPIAKETRDSSIIKNNLSQINTSIEDDKKLNSSATISYGSSMAIEYKKKPNVTKHIEEDPFKVLVKIVHVVSPSEIYVSDVAREMEFSKIEKKLQIKYDNHETIDKKSIEWKIGKICVVYCENAKYYYRGQIKDTINDNKFIVFLIDIGKTITVEKKNLQSIGFKFEQFPALVFRVKLGGMIPCGGSTTWPSSSCEKLRELIDNTHNAKFYITKVGDDEDGGPMIVELFCEQINVHHAISPDVKEILSINRRLLELGLAVQLKNYDYKKLKFLAFEVQREMSVNDLRIHDDALLNHSLDKSNDSECINSDSTVTPENSYPDDDEVSDADDYIDEIDENYVNSRFAVWPKAEKFQRKKFYGTSKFVSIDGCAYIVVAQPNKTTEKLRFIEFELSKVYPYKKCDTKLSDIKPGDICIAKMHTFNTWHRAEVLKIQKGKPLIRFVDWGNVEYCSPRFIHKMINYQDEPRQATKCQIYGLKSCNSSSFTKEDIDNIHGIIVEQNLFIEVVNNNSELPVVIIRLVNQDMIELVDFLYNVMRMNVYPPKPITQTLSNEDFDDDDDDEEEDDEVNVNDINVNTNTVDDDANNCDDIVERDFIEFEKSESPVDDRDVVLEETDSDDLEDLIDEGKVVMSMQQKFVDNANNDNDIIVNDKIQTNIYEGKFIRRNTDTSSDDYVSRESSLDINIKNPSITDDSDVKLDSPIDDSVQYEFKNLVIPNDVTIFCGALGEVNPLFPNLVTIHIDNTPDHPELSRLSKMYEKIMIEMQEFAETQPLVENISENIPCCAKYNFDGQWYRCLVKKKPPPYSNDPLIEVEFVDWGNTQMVDIDELRILRNKWMMLPKMAINCRIWGIEKPDGHVDPTIRDWLKTICDKIKKSLIIVVKNIEPHGPAVQIYTNYEKKKLVYQTLIDQKKFILDLDDCTTY